MAIDPAGDVVDPAPPASPATQTAPPSAFRDAVTRSPWRRRDRALRRRVGVGVLPDDAQTAAFVADLSRTDPVAERFVDEVPRRDAHRLLGQALGVDPPDELPDALAALMAELGEVPAWVRRDEVERGAAIWRRWSTMLFAAAGATTLEMYTENAVALPLALAGGYAGANARRRFLETVRFWIEVSEPGALFTRGSAGRATAMRVRVMHVGVRRRVAGHEAWDTARWGAPISQAYQTATLLGGSIGPALALWPLGHLTTPAEIRALLHFQRYLGHLLGVRPTWYPETVADAARLLLLVVTARAYDADGVDAELIESFPAGFAPLSDSRGVRRVREAWTHGMYGAYCRLWMAPATHRRYAMPSGLPWLAVPLLRAPLVAAAEIVGHLVPPAGRLLERVGSAYRARWYDAHVRTGRSDDPVTTG